MRGRPRRTVPSDRDAHILEAVREGNRKAHVAKVYGLSRQYVSEIAQRWPELAVREKPIAPYKSKK